MFCSFDRFKLNMFKSVFLLISPIARSKALCLKFALSDKGASRIKLPSASLTDSNPSAREGVERYKAFNLVMIGASANLPSRADNIRFMWFCSR
jgi:hypothetical protein